MKLWKKLAIALFLVALIPLAITAWQLAQRGAGEVRASARAYHVSVGESGVAAVNSLLDSAEGEAKTLAATIAMPGVDAEQRLSNAKAQLIGARVIENFVVFNKDGLDVEHMEGANKTAAATAGSVAAPVPLPDALRATAEKERLAIGAIMRRDDGALFLPMVVPLRKPDGALMGYGWTAIDLRPLGETVADISKRRFGDNALVTLIAPNDKGELVVVAHADPSRTWKTFGQPGQGAPSGVDIGLEAAGLKRDMSHTFDYVTSEGEARLGAVTPIQELGWGVVVEQPHKEVFQAVDRIWETALLIGGGLALVALLIGVFAGKRLAAPVVALSHAAKKVAGGDFTVQVPVPGSDEVGQLATSFNSMTRQLTDTIAKLQETTAAKERMQTELDIGHNIQMSMVPLKFPAFPERTDFDVHAALKPAFEVGGDFYDFFLVDDHTLCVCIADVSGKGVPAALFMAVTRTMVKTHAGVGASSEEILEKVNDDLAKDNDACMFVTVFLGLVDLRTGELTYTNAGHNPSYVKRVNGKIERLDKLHGPVVAAMEEVPYGKGSVKLAKGDTLILYTDGVAEAMNSKQELFTEERLARLLEHNSWSTSDAAVKLVLDDVWKFQGAADQADDVTVVALRYVGV